MQQAAPQTTLEGFAGAAAAAAAPSRYQVCLAELLEIEGGFSNDPYDRGGATMCGVTWQVYNSYRDLIGQPRQDVGRITRAEIADLYYRFYWLPSHAGDLPIGLDLAHWDFGVNSGPATAIKKLQQCLGVPADGHYGAVTAAAVRQAHIPTLIRRYVEIRRQYCRALPNYWRFGRGWENRWNRIEQSALRATDAHAWAANVFVEPPPVDPHERAAEQGRAIAEPPAPPIAAELGASGAGVGQIGMAMPRIFQQSYVAGRFSFLAFLLALAMEPWVWAGVAMIWGAALFYLWRRKHARTA